MSNLEGPVTLLIAIFDNETDATIGVASLERIERRGAIELQDAAVLVREGSSDSVRIKETEELTSTKGALRGAAAGGIIGVIFPPAVLAAGALGAAAGAALGHVTDQGINNAL